MFTFDQEILILPKTPRINQISERKIPQVRNQREVDFKKTGQLPQLKIIHLQTQVPHFNKNLNNKKESEEKSKEKSQKKIIKEFKKNINTITQLKKIKISDVIKKSYLYLGSVKEKDSENSATQCLFDFDSSPRNLKDSESNLSKIKERVRLHNSQRNRPKQFNLVYRDIFMKKEDKEALNLAHKKKEFFSIHSFSKSKIQKYEDLKESFTSRGRDFRPDFVRRAIMDPNITEKILKKYKNSRKKLRDSYRKTREGREFIDKYEDPNLGNLEKFSTIRTLRTETQKEMSYNPKSIKKINHSQGKSNDKMSSFKSLNAHISPPSYRIKNMKRQAYVKKKKLRRSSSLAFFKKSKNRLNEKSDEISISKKNSPKELTEKKFDNLWNEDKSINPWNNFYEDDDQYLYMGGEVGGFGVQEYLDKGDESNELIE